MKKLLTTLFIMLMVIANAGSSMLGGAGIAVRDPWNDADFLPAAAAFYPGGMEFVLDFDLWRNSTVIESTSESPVDYNADAYNTTMTDTLSVLCPALKGRMRMGPLAFSLKFKSPLLNYTNEYDRDNDYDTANPGTDYVDELETGEFQNGFPMDLSFKLGFAFSRMFGLGFNFSFFSQTLSMTNNYYYYRVYPGKTDDPLEQDDTQEMEIDMSDLTFGLGFISHLDTLLAGLSFQMFNFKNVGHLTAYSYWERNNSGVSDDGYYVEVPDSYIDDKDSNPWMHVNMNGIRINGVVRYMKSENFTGGLVLMMDSLSGEVVYETGTMGDLKMNDISGVIFTFGPGIWYHNDKVEFGADLVLMMPSLGVDSLTYYDMTYPDVVEQEMNINAFIIVYRAGAKVNLGKLTLAAGFSKMSVSGSAESIYYDTGTTPGTGIEADSSEESITTVPFLSNLSANFNFVYHFSETMGINYGIYWGVQLNENNPNIVKDLIPALLPAYAMMGGSGVADPNKLVTHKISFFILK